MGTTETITSYALQPRKYRPASLKGALADASKQGSDANVEGTSPLQTSVRKKGPSNYWSEVAGRSKYLILDFSNVTSFPPQEAGLEHPKVLEAQQSTAHVNMSAESHVPVTGQAQLARRLKPGARPCEGNKWTVSSAPARWSRLPSCQ